MNKASMIAKWVVMGVIFILAFGWLTMILWNWLLPSLFEGAREITFLQALGLLLLCKILFSGFGGKRWGSHSPTWKKRYYEKLSHMSPEDREKFKQRMREKWCYHEPAASTQKSDTSNA